MAVTQNTLIGRTRQSVGGTTFSTWKGLNILKSKPISVANPKTVPQETQRAKMTLVVGLYRLLASLVVIGFRGLAVGKSEYNAFTSYNLKNAVSGTAPEFVFLEPQNFSIARGTMGTTEIDDINASAGDTTYDLQWDQNAAPVGSSPNDVAHAALYWPLQDTWVAAPNAAVRSDGSLTITLPAPAVGEEGYELYLFFENPITGAVSDSTTESVSTTP